MFLFNLTKIIEKYIILLNISIKKDWYKLKNVSVK